MNDPSKTPELFQLFRTPEQFETFIKQGFGAFKKERYEGFKVYLPHGDLVAGLDRCRAEILELRGKLAAKSAAPAPATRPASVAPAAAPLAAAKPATVAAPASKPAAPAGKVMTFAAFTALPHPERNAFMRNGGKIVG